MCSIALFGFLLRKNLITFKSTDMICFDFTQIEISPACNRGTLCLFGKKLGIETPHTAAAKKDRRKSDKAYPSHFFTSQNAISSALLSSSLAPFSIIDAASSRPSSL